MIDHCDLCRRHRRVVVGERKYAGTERDRRARIGKARDKGEARGNRLGRIHKVLTDEGLAIAESIGEYDCLVVLAKNVPIGPGRRVDGLDEKSNRDPG